MYDIILNLTQEELTTIITALRMEKARYQKEKDDKRLSYVEAALSAVNNQPWSKNSRDY